jgi:hypothetical protein
VSKHVKSNRHHWHLCSASKQQDDKRSGAWLITVHVIEPVVVLLSAKPQVPAVQAQALPSTLTAGEVVLVPHDWHAVMPLNLYFPAPQSGQEVEPTTVESFPASQLAQLSADEFDQAVLYLPVPHGWRRGSVKRKSTLKTTKTIGTCVQQASSKTTSGQGRGSSPCTSSSQLPYC